MAHPRLQDKHAVITGGSSGIGRALAHAFGREGATVWLGARREDALREVAREVEKLGGRARAVRLDVTDDASVAAFAQAIERGAPGVDVLVNNAGIGAWGTTDEIEPDLWRRVMDTNLTGPFLVTRALLPLLRKREGRRQVFNIVSVAGKQASAGGGVYAASKFGLRGWTEALAGELAEEGIRVTGILPGYVATPMVEGAGDATRMIQPEDLGHTLVEVALLPESVFVDELVVWPWKMYAD